ncbi:class I SAM-dependent methyltransferase [Stackebrandtia soli]|uniref:class I SAM-dependent methyltransferase n=1 Tax=Stackebrandtia soli TaxID=1892856 RepID=UPI0039E9E784
MIDGWEWDDTLFLGSAPHYQRGRVPYAPGVPDLLVETLHLDGSGRLLDVGCGPGTLALDLAHLFTDVVGVDPDRGMLDEARRRADEAKTPNARWIRARAETLPNDLGTFDVATFGQSFHWMDRDAVATTIKDLLRTGGAFVHIADLKTETRSTDGLAHPAVPYAEIGELVTRHLGPVRRAGQGVIRHGTPGGEAEVLARAGFLGPRRVIAPGGAELRRTSADVISWVYSMSSSAPHLFGEHLNDFEAELGSLLQQVSPGGLFAERQPSTEIIIWRKPT